MIVKQKKNDESTKSSASFVHCILSFPSLNPPCLSLLFVRQREVCQRKVECYFLHENVFFQLIRKSRKKCYVFSSFEKKMGFEVCLVGSLYLCRSDYNVEGAHADTCFFSVRPKMEISSLLKICFESKIKKKRTRYPETNPRGSERNVS